LNAPSRTKKCRPPSLASRSSRSAAFRRPALTFAEIAWRWTLGATAWALLLFSFFEYLNTLPVTHADATLLSTRHPALVGRALTHILRGSLNRVVLAALLGALALSLLWIVAASIGRAATVRALLDYFAGRRNVADDSSAEASEKADSLSLRSLVGLHFLRVATVLAALLALVGAAILAGFVSSEAKPQPGLAFILFLPLAGLIFIAWPMLNWVLSLACVFSIRDGEDALGALAAAVTFSSPSSSSTSARSTTQLIARRIREQNVFSVVLPCTASLDEVKSYAPVGIVLSGAPWSVYDKDAPPADRACLRDWDCPCSASATDCSSWCTRSAARCGRRTSASTGMRKSTLFPSRCCSRGWRSGSRVDVARRRSAGTASRF
jgi:hypothetical protein